MTEKEEKGKEEKLGVIRLIITYPWGMPWVMKLIIKMAGLILALYQVNLLLGEQLITAWYQQIIIGSLGIFCVCWVLETTIIDISQNVLYTYKWSPKTELIGRWLRQNMGLISIITYTWISVINKLVWMIK